MNSGFASFSDDFFVNVDLHTALPLPQGRETVLQFFEAAQKQFADMAEFFQRESGEYVLEGDRNADSYRWVELEPRRLCSGCFNPPEPANAYQQHTWLLERSRYYLGVSHLDIESLDLVYGFNFDFTGNRDAIVWEALVAGSRLAALAQADNAVALNCEPSLVVALNPECSLQARLAVETRNSSYQVRSGNYEEEPISVYFTIRTYPRSGQRFEPTESLAKQAEVGEDLLTRVVLPKIIRPIASAIAAAQ
jgi:hypothetical protein